jgi:hypothetical protein
MISQVVALHEAGSIPVQYRCWMRSHPLKTLDSCVVLLVSPPAGVVLCYYLVDLRVVVRASVLEAVDRMRWLPTTVCDVSIELEPAIVSNDHGMRVML